MKVYRICIFYKDSVKDMFFNKVSKFQITSHTVSTLKSHTCQSWPALKILTPIQLNIKTNRWLTKLWLISVFSFYFMLPAHECPLGGDKTLHHSSTKALFIVLFSSHTHILYELSVFASVTFSIYHLLSGRGWRVRWGLCGHF